MNKVMKGVSGALSAEGAGGLAVAVVVMVAVLWFFYGMKPRKPAGI